MSEAADEDFDAQIDSTFVEVKSGLNAVRNVRAGLLGLAYALQSHPDHRGLLVLAGTNITAARLEKEWDLAQQTLRPKWIERLGIVVFQDGNFSGYPELPPPAFLARLEEVVRHETNHAGRRMPRADFFSEILKVLIHDWLLKKESMTSGRLQEIVGCTYPTTAKALAKLSPYLQRNSDRSIALDNFPRSAWSALLARGDDVRQTTRFIDRSGQQRTPENFARRLVKLGRNDLAVGGVLGARSHYPKLDLAGTPRVDLTVHCPGARLDLDFISRIDPGLSPASSASEPAALVVHVLRRKEAWFTPMPEGGWRADPVECLLDLHEARLETQAAEFFNAIAPAPLSP